MNITRGGIVTGWGIAVPDKVVTNDDLSVTMDTNDAWIRERTGIRERRIGGTTSQLAIEAGLAALEKAGRRPDEIDAVILATTTPDQIVPGTVGHRPGRHRHPRWGLRRQRRLLRIRLRPDRGPRHAGHRGRAAAGHRARRP